MKNRHRVVWTKGMFLNPQHFQTQDQYFEDTLQFRMSASQYANWGVIKLSIDEEALAGGSFALIGAHGIMRDGVTFEMPEVDRLPASREIGDLFPPLAKELDVYLTIPELRPQAANVTMTTGKSNGTPDTRFTAEMTPVSDLISGEEQKDVPLARKNFRLLFGTEYREGSNGLRIAQVVRDPNRVYKLKATHIAPCLDIAHNPYLIGLLQTFVGMLSNKSASLSEGRSESSTNLADFSASDTSNFWLLHTVNSSLPELKHIWRVRHGHPEQAYLALTRLAGSLATFALDFSLDELPDYDHLNLGACFVTLEKQIRLLIDPLFVEPFIRIPLTLGNQNIWTGSISDKYFEDSQFYLSIKVKNEIGELKSKMSMARVSAVDDINMLIARALTGVSLTHEQAPPAIRMKLGTQYFSLGQTGERWEKLKRSRNIAIQIPADIQQPILELLIVKTRQD